MSRFVRNTGLEVALGALFAYGIMAGAAGVASAAQAITDAVVEVVDAPIITETADLQFGRVLKPTTGTNDIRVSTTGNRTLLGGGDGALIGGTVRAASYTIEAVAGLTVSIEAALLDAGGSGLTLADFTGSYDGSPSTGIDPADGATFPAASSAALAVGADLEDISPTTAATVHTLTFTLDVNYQ